MNIMRNVNFLKTSLICGVLSSNLLNSNAMEINSYNITTHHINNNEYINEIEYVEKGYKNSEFIYFKEDNQVSTLKIIHFNDYIKIIDLETNINFRRQGFATKLLLFMFNSESILNNGIKVLPKIILDSTDQGYNLYKNLGFKENGEKDVMNLQPMELIWDSNIRKKYLTLNENNKIVLKNNIINNNNKKNDNSYDDLR